jgi:hypothetical protein
MLISSSEETFLLPIPQSFSFYKKSDVLLSSPSLASDHMVWFLKQGYITSSFDNLQSGNCKGVSQSALNAESNHEIGVHPGAM